MDVRVVATKGRPIPSTGEGDADNKKESEMSTNDHRVWNVTRNGIVWPRIGVEESPGIGAILPVEGRGRVCI
jgi:hypothetical protein